MKSNQIIRYERSLLHKVTNAIGITNKLLIIDIRNVHHFSSQDLEEMADLVHSLFNERLVETGKGCSIKDAQDFVADVFGDRSEDSLVAEAYNSSKISLAKILFGSDKLDKSGKHFHNLVKELNALDYSNEEIKEALLEIRNTKNEIKVHIKDQVELQIKNILEGKGESANPINERSESQ